MSQMQQAAAATTAAGTGAAMAASYGPAAAAASVASFGGAAVAGMSALAAAIPSMLGLFKGGRQYGGNVAANGLYRINETGAPEVFNAANGRQYMMPNQRGEVVSNADATSSPAETKAPIVNVYNAPQGTSVQGRMVDDQYILDVVIGSTESDGRMHQAFTGKYGVRTVGR
ncbi:hypothetical protein D3C78_1170990 [compost metagenome]